MDSSRTGVEPGPLWFERCLVCTHRTGSLTCAAFPDEIPDAIQAGDFDHAQPFAGDHGIQFTPR